MERKWEGVNEGGGRVSDFVREKRRGGVSNFEGVKRRGGRERKERGRVGGRE